MGRVIQTNQVGTERTRLTKSIVLAIRELMRQSQPDDHSRDLAAYIGLALAKVYETIESSVAAWEKRGYWVKADRFRMEWGWSASLGRQMRLAVLAEDWRQVALLSVAIADKLKAVQVSVNHRLGSPWESAYRHLKVTGA